MNDELSAKAVGTGSEGAGPSPPGCASTVTSEAIAKFHADESSPPIHNFVGDKRTVWQLTSRCVGGGSVKVDPAKEPTINVKYWYMHRQEMVNDRTGEVTCPIRVVLLDADLNAVAFMSTGVAKSLQTLIDAMGPGPYDPPLAVRLRQVRTGAGRIVVFFEPA